MLQSNLCRSASSFFGPELDSRKIVAKKSIVNEDGCPVISFSDGEINKLSSPLSTTLVGKFSNGVPSISEISKSLKVQNLKGNFSTSFFNAKTVIIRLLLKEDFDYLWMKQSIYVENCLMRLAKWTPSFNAAMDSPIVPIWISLRQVPIMLFHPEALFELVRPLGNPLKVDSATAAFTSLERARVLVEVDISKAVPEALFVEFLGQKVKVRVSLDSLPVYCDFCCKIGHRAVACFLKNPHLKSVSNLNRRCVSSEGLQSMKVPFFKEVLQDANSSEGEKSIDNSNWEIPTKTARCLARQESQVESVIEKAKHNFVVLENLEVLDSELDSLPPLDMVDILGQEREHSVPPALCVPSVEVQENDLETIHVAMVDILVSTVVVEQLASVNGRQEAHDDSAQEKGEINFGVLETLESQEKVFEPIFSGLVDNQEEVRDACVPLPLEKFGIPSSGSSVVDEQVAPVFGHLAESPEPPPQPPEKKKGRTTKNSSKTSYSSSLPMLKAVLRKSRSGRYSPHKFK